MLDPVRLHALRAVSRYGTLAAAAHALALTPQAVSQQIGKLEREVDAALLERRGRGVVLTDAARVLVDAAEGFERVEETARVRLERLRDRVAGTLRIDCFPTGIRGLAAPAVAALRTLAPDLTVTLHEELASPALESVAAGGADLAVVHRWDDQPQNVAPGLVAERIGQDSLDVILPAGHPLTAGPTVAMADLADETWITEEPHTTCAHFLTASMAAAGRTPRILYRAGEYESQIALAAHGLGVCVVPRLGRGALPPGLTARPIAGVSPHRVVYATHRAATSRRPAIALAVEALRREMPSDR